MPSLAVTVGTGDLDGALNHQDAVCARIGSGERSVVTIQLITEHPDRSGRLCDRGGHSFRVIGVDAIWPDRCMWSRWFTGHGGSGAQFALGEQGSKKWDRGVGGGDDLHSDHFGTRIRTG